MLRIIRAMIAPALLTAALLAQAPAAAPRDEYLYLTTFFEADGFASVSPATPGDFDGAGNAFPAELLGSEVRFEVKSARFGNIVFLRPPVEGDQKNVVVPRGQKIRVRSRNTFNAVFWLGAAHGGPADGWVEYAFEDGSSARVPIGLSDWQGLPVFREEAAFRSQRVAPRTSGARTRVTPVARTGATSVSSTAAASLRLQWTPIPGNKKLASITLPRMEGAGIVAITLGRRDGLAAVPALPPPPEPAPGPAPVAIFREPGFPSFLGAASFSPEDLARDLKELGIESAFLRAEHLADLKVLVPERFPVLVQIYGNAFPAAAEEALRAYRKAGGAMVHCGVPFTRPARATSLGVWLVLGHSDAHLVHDGERALGSGGFSTLAATKFSAADELSAWGLGGLPWGELRLKSSLPDYWFGFQCLTAPSLAPTDEVLPLLRLAGSAEDLLAAAVRHKGCGFDRCLDVWTGVGEFFAGPAHAPTALRRHLVLRSVVWALKERGLVPEEVWKRAVQPLAPEVLSVPALQPTLPPAAADLRLPRGAALPEVVLAVSIDALTDSERVLAASAQGLASRAGAKAIYLVASGADRALLERLESATHVKRVVNANLKDALGAVGHKRAVVVDPELHGSLNLATMVAAAEGLLVAYPGDVAAHGLEAAMDLRGVFASGAEMLAWTREHVLDRLERKAVVFAPPVMQSYRLRDYAIAHRLPVLWLAARQEAAIHGASPHAEYAALLRVFERLDVGTPVLASFASAGFEGFDAAAAVELLSSFGLPLFNAGGLANLSVLAAVRAEGSAPRERVESDGRTAEARKVYLSFIETVRTDQVAALTAANVQRQPAAPAPADEFKDERGLALESAAEDLVSFQRAEFLSAHAPKSYEGLVVPGQVSTAAFASAYGAERPRALGAFLRRSVAGTAGGACIFLPDSPLLDGLLRDTEAMGPENLHAVFAASPILAGRPLAAHSVVGGVPLLRSVSAAALEGFLRELKESKALAVALPAFIWSDAPLAEAQRLKTAGLLDERVVLVSLRELARLCRAWHQEHALVRQDLVREGSLWKYDDTGKDLGTAWRRPELEDSAWKSGKAELGFGDGREGRPEATLLSFGADPNQKVCTYYFRTSFEYAPSSEPELLLLEVLADDGCVVYLNGAERFRFNLPEGGPSASTFAARALATGEEQLWRSAGLSPSVLVPGRNTVAVEVHQSDAKSSDLSFDLALTGLRWAKREAREAEGTGREEEDRRR
jgi:hypothetical protein